MKSGTGVALLSICLLISAGIIANAYKYKFTNQDRIVVTGLGEKEFTSDFIVWNGWITEKAATPVDGYLKLEQSKNKVIQFITARGIEESNIKFDFVNVNQNYDPIYSKEGNFQGHRYTDYTLSQWFTIESSEVDLVESISREISALIAEGVNMDLKQPFYYFTQLDDLKHELIETAAKDARKRAEKIADNSKARIKALGNARMGVFQITGANSNEEFSAGGSFNTSSKNKKARITIRQEYIIK